MTDTAEEKYQHMEFTPYYAVNAMTLTQYAHDMGYNIWFQSGANTMTVYFQDITDLALFRIKAGV